MIYKRCSRCGKRLKASEKCSCLKNRHKEYNYYRKDNKEQRFYTNEKEWIPFKIKMVDHYKGFDIYEYYVNHKIVYGYTLHHVDELKDNWSRRVDPFNVIYLTESNHQKIHKVYREGKEQKYKMQELLFELINKWNKEFGNVILF